MAGEKRKQGFPRVNREEKPPPAHSVFPRVDCIGLPGQNPLSLYNRLMEEPCLAISRILQGGPFNRKLGVLSLGIFWSSYLILKQIHSSVQTKVNLEHFSASHNVGSKVKF